MVSFSSQSCLSVVLQWQRGQVTLTTCWFCFYPNKHRSSEPFLCLDQWKEKRTTMAQLSRFTDVFADGQTNDREEDTKKKNRVMSCQRRPGNNNNTEQHTHTHTHTHTHNTHTGGRGIPIQAELRMPKLGGGPMRGRGANIIFNTYQILICQDTHTDDV